MADVTGAFSSMETFALAAQHSEFSRSFSQESDGPLDNPDNPSLRGLSEYELMRQRNIQQNNRALARLGLIPVSPRPNPHLGAYVRADSASAQFVSVGAHPPQPSEHSTTNLSLIDRKSTMRENLRGGACCVCMENAAIICFVPCGHISVCSICSLQLENCPICRVRVETRLEVFAS